MHEIQSEEVLFQNPSLHFKGSDKIFCLFFDKCFFILINKLNYFLNVCAVNMNPSLFRPGVFIIIVIAFFISPWVVESNQLFLFFHVGFILK